MNNKGYTMVELLVGFTLLAVLMAVFIGAIKLGSNMLMYSSDSIAARERFEEEYYKTNSVSDARDGKSDFFQSERVRGNITLEKEDGSESIDLNSGLIKVWEKEEQTGIRIFLIESNEE